MKLLLQFYFCVMCLVLTTPSTYSFPLRNLERNFVENILREYDNSPTLRICDIFVENATNPGDSWVSDLYRIHADGFKNGESCISKESPTQWSYDYTKHLIVKIPHADEIASHESEIYVYEVAIPKLEKYLPTNTALEFAKLVNASVTSKKEKIILEDWAQFEYSKLDRRRPYSPETLESALTELAKLHAASIIMKQNATSTFAQIASNLPDYLLSPLKREKVLKYFNDSFQMAKLRSEHPNFVRLYNLPKEGEQHNNIFERDPVKILELATTEINKYENSKHLEVIAHADFWQINVMAIKRNPGNIKIIDMGKLCKSNLVRDLIYIFATSPMKNEDRPKLVESYLQKLKSFLRQGYVTETTIEKYTTELIMDEIRRLRDFELFVGLLFAVPTQFTLVPSEDEIKGLSHEARQKFLLKYLDNGFDLRVGYIISSYQDNKPTHCVEHHSKIAI